MKNKMFLVSLLVTALVLSPCVHAANYGFGLDAFNRSVSVATRGNAVFSPISFEFDCVIFCESFGAMVRAKFAETMGVMNGLDSNFRPIYKELTKDDVPFTFLSARAFCLPEERSAHYSFRHWIQQAFSAEAFGMRFKKGAECWFRSRMDGLAEDFELPLDAASDRHYSYYDMVYYKCPWGSSSNSVTTIDFNLEDGSVCKVDAVHGVQPADVWKRKSHTVVRFQMADETSFFVLLPDVGTAVREIRPLLNSNAFPELLTGIQSVTEENITHGLADFSMPKMKIHTGCDLKSTFEYFRFPKTEMTRVEKGLRPRYFEQRTYFELDEKGIDGTGKKKTKDPDEEDEDAPAAIAPSLVRLSLDRPFLFFLYHEPTHSIPVAGQFMGK